MNEMKSIHPFNVYKGIEEVAETLDKSVSTVRRMIDDGLECHRMGHNTFFTGEQILRYINNGDTKCAHEAVSSFAALNKEEVGRRYV